MYTEERHKKIVQILEEKKRISTKELAKILNVSIDSVRRDFIKLENLGILQRMHGGAMLKQQTLVLPLHSIERYKDIDNETFAIAKTAVRYIKENETIYIGGTSIHYAMVNYLPNNINYTVVTNSIVVAERIKDMDNINTILIGGTLKPSGNITDSLAIEMLRLFHFDLVFITGGGFTDKSITTSSIDVALFTKNLVEKSERTIALMHHSKFGRNLFSHVTELEKVDVLITDAKIKKCDVLFNDENELDFIIAK